MAWKDVYNQGKRFLSQDVGLNRNVFNVADAKNNATKLFSREGLGSAKGIQAAAQGAYTGAVAPVLDLANRTVVGGPLKSTPLQEKITKAIYAPGTAGQQDFNQTQKDINQGFQVAGALAPYSAAEAAVGRAARLVPTVRKAVEAGGVAGKAARFGVNRFADVASGQLLADPRGMTAKDRVKQAGVDAVTGGALEGASTLVARPLAKKSVQLGKNIADSDRIAEVLRLHDAPLDDPLEGVSSGRVRDDVGRFARGQQVPVRVNGERAAIDPMTGDLADANSRFITREYTEQNFEEAVRKGGAKGLLTTYDATKNLTNEPKVRAVIDPETNTVRSIAFDRPEFKDYLEKSAPLRSQPGYLRIKSRPKPESPLKAEAQAERALPNQVDQTGDVIPRSGLAKIGETPAEAPKGRPNLATVKQNLGEIYTQTINRYAPLERLGNQAGKLQEVKSALTQHYGAGSTATYHADYELAPILKSVDEDALKAYAIAQRDMELAGRGIKGSDALEAETALNNLKAQGFNLDELEGAAQRLYAYQDNIVKTYLVDTGVMSQDAYNAMRGKNQRYVPFQRVMDEVDKGLGISKQAGSVASQNVIKGIKGSNRDIVDPIQSIVENTYKTVALGRRNAVARTLVSLKDSLPEGTIKPLEGEVGNKSVISVFEDGVNKKYEVPQEVADAAKGMDEEQLSAVVKLFQPITSAFRTTATGANPEFFLPNVTRDLQSAFVNKGLNPLMFAKGMASYLKRDQLFQDFLKAGGQTSRVSLDRPSIVRRASELTATGGVSWETLKHPVELLGRLGEVFEQPTRIALFSKELNKLKRQGVPDNEALVRAAEAAQEGTTNFARRGSKTANVNVLYAFLNARVQGVDQLARSFKKDPAGTAFRAALVSQAPALALYAWNREHPEYFDDRYVSKYDKRNNFIVMLPGGNYLKVPKGDVGKLANPTEEFLAYLDGRPDVDAKGALKEALLAFSPIQNTGDLIPTAGRPVVENQMNRNFFTGRDIVPSWKKDYPAQDQVASDTQPLYRQAADTLGSVGIQTSPAKLQNAARGYLTGYARLAEGATQNSFPQYPNPAAEGNSALNSIPVVRRFAGGAKRSEDEQAEMDQSRTESLQKRISALRNGIIKGDINEREGNKKIQELEAQLGTVTTPAEEGAGRNAAQAASGDLAIDQAKFAVKSGKKERVDIGDTVVYKDKNGKVQTRSKAELAQKKADYEREVKIDRAEQNKDYENWESLQKDYYNSLALKQRDLDPELDVDEYIRIQKQKEAILKKVKTYRSYGRSFTEPKKGRSRRSRRSASSKYVRIR